MLGMSRSLFVCIIEDTPGQAHAHVPSFDHLAKAEGVLAAGDAIVCFQLTLADLQASQWVSFETLGP